MHSPGSLLLPSLLPVAGDAPVAPLTDFLLTGGWHAPRHAWTAGLEIAGGDLAALGAAFILRQPGFAG